MPLFILTGFPRKASRSLGSRAPVFPPRRYAQEGSRQEHTTFPQALGHEPNRGHGRSLTGNRRLRAARGLTETQDANLWVLEHGPPCRSRSVMRRGLFPRMPPITTSDRPEDTLGMSSSTRRTFTHGETDWKNTSCTARECPPWESPSSHADLETEGRLRRIWVSRCGNPCRATPIRRPRQGGQEKVHPRRSAGDGPCHAASV